jgi:hypothetical protein
LWSVSEGCLSTDDDGKVITTVVGQQTSAKEQREKGWRSIGDKIRRAKSGEYPGGYPPYGMDVVCIGGDGKEKWRLVWVGKWQRVKYNANGTEETYNGKGNSPSHDKTDTLFYRPSVRKERLETVLAVMRMYAEQRISPSQIANQLTAAGVPCVFGEAWQKGTIKEILRNPVYIGLPSYNKRGGGRFWEYVGGEMRRVQAERGRVKAGRKRDKSDWVGPDRPLYPPIVPVELFNKVQHKLERDSAEYREKVKPRSPRTASFYLRNLLYCAGCGRPMRAWNANTDGSQPYRSYFCANYGQYGRNNPSGCQSNRIRAALLEKMVEQYLTETHAKIAGLLAATETEPAILQPLQGELAEKAGELFELRSAMVKTVAEYERHHGAIREAITEEWIRERRATQKETQSIRPVPTTAFYQFVFNKRKPELERELAELDTEHTGLVDRVLSLPKGATAALEKANTRIMELEPRMAAIKRELENIADRYGGLVRELENRQRIIEAARKGMKGDEGYRKKAELIGQVISQIIAHFQPSDEIGNKPRSKLVKVEIVPREGDTVCLYPDGVKLGQG